MGIKLVNPKKVGMSAERLADIDDIMERGIREKMIKGSVTLVARKGEVVQFKAYGEADVGKPMQTDAIFRLASMSKPIGATAVMQLFDRGKVMLTDPVAMYIPAFAAMQVAVPVSGGFALQPLKRQITIHDLLTMTSGITSTEKVQFGNASTMYCAQLLRDAGIVDCMRPLDMNLEEYVNIAVKVPLAAQPGERWDYANTNVLTLGRIVEIVSGMPLDEYLKKNIFEPLEMTDTCFFPEESKWNRFPVVFAERTMERLTGYDLPGTDDTQLPFSDVKRFFNLAGGLMGTTEDYLHFTQMLLNGGVYNGKRILSQNAVRLMTTNRIGDLNDAFFGNKWGYLMSVQGDKMSNLLHFMGPGSITWSGYWGTSFNAWPEKDVTAIFMTQVSTGFAAAKTYERFFNVVANAIED